MNTARLNQGTPLLLNGVTKRYGENTILNGLDLHIPAGQFVAVVGRSGGGKSTLLRLLAGLEAPNGGEILAGTTPLANIQDDTRMMFQDARLLPWKTVIDNVGLGLKGNWRDEARQALAAVGLEHRANEWPAALSGGQKQRLAVAACIATGKRLLVFDEPTSGLDLHRMRQVARLIHDVRRRGAAQLVITHDPEFIMACCSWVVRLEDGGIMESYPLDAAGTRRLSGFFMHEGALDEKP